MDKAAGTFAPAPATALGFSGLSPYALPDVIEAAEAIPYVELTDWNHDRLYALKGQIVASGIRQITGIDMPVFPKRRFQHGAADGDTFRSLFPQSDRDYRDEFARAFKAIAK